MKTSKQIMTRLLGNSNLSSLRSVAARMLVGFGICATAPAFGQTTYIWSGAGDGTNLAAAANWGGTAPGTANNDTAEWNGTVPGNLVLYYNNSAWQSGPGQSGINFYLTSSQTGSVQVLDSLASPAYLAITYITIDPGAGAFTLGDTNPAYRLDVIGRPNGAIHTYINNSTNTATINPRVRWAGGGGADWTFDFQGTGDWQCNNYLVNDNGPGMSIQVDGPGTMFWNPTGYLGANGIDSPIFINGGMLVLEAPHVRLGTQAIGLAGNFEFNAPSQSQALSGAITGGGSIIVNNGTLTLSGQSSYTGSNILTGGELIVNGAENPGAGTGPLGTGGAISFLGGALGFSVNNIFDYSGRFSAETGQMYKIDTAGQNVTFTNATGLSGAGNTLTKIGAGTLTLAGPSTYTGLTTVNAGRLLFQGSKTGSGSIMVADGAILGVTATGSQVTPGTLTLGTSSGVTLGFNNVNSTSTALIAAGTLVSAGTVTVNVNSGTFTPGQSYPLLSWTSGSAPTVVLGVLNGYVGNLSVSGNTLSLNITATAYSWSGANNGNWDLTTANNWIQNSTSAVYADGGPVLFDDTVTGTTAVTISSLVQPASVTFNNVNSNYSITSSAGNDIAGSATLTMNNSGTVTLAGGANTYTGVTTINAGVLSVSTLAGGGSPSDIGAAGTNAANLVLNGGTLQYTGAGASSDHLFTIGLAGGAIDASGSGALNLSNASVLGYNGNGARTLSLTGSDASGDTLAAVIGDNGGATSLAKNGSGSWVLAGNNTYSGLTTVNSGVLQVGAGGSTGSLGSGNIVDNGGLDFNRTGTLTVNGVISGSGSVTNDGTGTVILANNNSYSGGTTINAGTLQVGNGGASGALAIASPILDNGTLIFNSKSAITIRGYGANITGTGNVWVRGTGLVMAVGVNSYSGWTTIDSGATFEPTTGNEGIFSGLGIITNNGTLLFIRQDFNPALFGLSNNIVGTGKVVKDNNNFNAGWIALAGTNSYTGGTFINGGGIVLGDGINPGAGVIVGPVIFTNTTTSFLNTRTLIFNRADDFTFTNTIVSTVTDGSAVADRGALEQSGPGMVTLTGSISYPGATTIDPGMVMQFGNGGTGGAIGTGNVSDSGTLIINHSDNVTISSAIADGTSQGSLIQFGTGTLTLSASNSYTGFTTVSNGTLVVSGGYIGGDLNVEGGTVASAPAGTVSTLNVAGNLNIDSGTILVTLNKSLAQSNSIVLVTNVPSNYSGVINATGGKLKLVNVGPQVKVGDKFYLFSELVNGGGNISIESLGFTVQNNLATDGSVTVTGVSAPPTVAATVSGTQLNLSWPAAYTGMVLQVQTNSLSVGLGTNWVTIPGTDSGNTYTATLNPANKAVFYRLAP